MITTRNIKTKETMNEKVTIITTGGVKPQLFNPRGKSKPFDERMITTSNVAQRKRELEKDMKRIEDKRKKDEKKDEKKAEKLAERKELKKKA